LYGVFEKAVAGGREFGMTDVVQEVMTPQEAARWFRRSITWLRQQRELVQMSGPRGQPLYHVRVCRAYLLGRMQRLGGAALRQVQLAALASACGVPLADAPAAMGLSPPE
jgi:hypothetical protein